ncbi:hypothetical protein BVI1335_1520009 [Burkholderia vietnamiensis]|nr:hypothetical protein BVI1335_1520009 [Burkholderia vietnamiensis]
MRPSRDDYWAKKKPGFTRLSGIP